ncbi:cytochrome P450 [Williamsia sp. DF01-3]|uniref:cytochrome P450 n=1 Tax=Williamsia sp. DF01-3 TaxID=2934157 RepID=UPI001FF6FAB0|nr:cytochrome P450 [Williamsia sp. DF01-3]MCK0518842.1 cytochrome P450 [Williamsia sp. DF01-3]
MNAVTDPSALQRWKWPDGTTSVLSRPWDHGRRPIHFDEQTQSWVISGYNAAREVLLGTGWSSDPLAAEVSRQALRANGLEDAPLAQTMLSLDPPDHGRARGALRDVFTPRYIASMSDGIAAIAAEVIGDVASGVTFDLMSRIAEPLPIAVIAEWLALEPHVAQLMWDKTSELVLGLEGTILPSDDVPSISGLTAVLAEFLPVCAERRQQPENDLLSLLATDPQLELDEVVSNAILLAVAGHETTAKLLGTSMIRLCAGDVGDRLIDTLDDVGADRVIDELLRLDGTAQIVVRAATGRREIDGHTIEPGARVIVAIAAANRDPEVFEAPDEFRPDRDKGRPHLALGYGRHRCLGAALAKLELAIALRQLCARRPQLAGPVTWHASGILRGPTQVPLVFTDRAER